jgi:hypothetical protein
LDMRGEKISERQLAEIWKNRLKPGSRFITENGGEIQVIYPGRQNDGRGGDFRDAVILSSRGLTRGDVELHVRSRGWEEHGHHRNAACNRVILHVVYRHDAARPARLQNGREIPVLALNKYLEIRPDTVPFMEDSSSGYGLPCAGVFRSDGKKEAVDFLDRAGMERFLEKAGRSGSDFSVMPPGQSLYRGIMAALGYSQNKAPFLELAGRLPLARLETGDAAGLSDKVYLERQRAGLLETAGFAPEGRTVAGGMLPGDWQLYRVRPNNSPYRRIEAMCRLLLRYRGKGLFRGLLELVGESRNSRELEAGLLVDSLGRGRAAEIIVNVLLPFTFAWSEASSCPETGAAAIRHFRSFPRSGENSLERHMSRQWRTGRDVINSAARQQGLIHVYEKLCTRGGCRKCRLGELQAWKNVQPRAVPFPLPEAEVAAGGNHGGVIGA